MSALNKIKDMLADISFEQKELRDMIVRWDEGNGDPSADPGIQYEQECKVEKMLVDFFAYTKLVSPLYDGTNLHKYVAVLRDGSYVAGYEARTTHLQEAEFFRDETDAVYFCRGIQNVDRIVLARDLIEENR